MKLLLTRVFFLPDRTIGRLFIDGVYFCDTLEDKNRDINHNGKFDNKESKVYGETCIPFGEYKVEVTYSPKFKRELPILLEVPNFEGIRIHRGNYIKDTLGCILVGDLGINNNIKNSTITEKKLVDLLRKEKDIIIEII